MYLARFEFGSARRRERRRELRELAERYLVALYQGGQTYGRARLAWSRGKLLAFVYLPRPQAPQSRFLPPWGEPDLAKVVEAFGREPSWSVLDDDVPQRFPSWKASSSLYLFTCSGDELSPVCCGDTGRAVPLYLLPVPAHVRCQLVFWAEAYRRHEQIWLDSRDLEIPAYKQLADPQSELSLRGRELGALVEKATKIPTFYFVARYWGRREGEDTRACAGCGRRWHVSRVGEGDPHHEFRFRCRRCRLVSHTAASDADQRRARIGEFRS